MSSPASVFRSSTLLFFIAVSFFGLCLISVITLNPPVSQENFSWRKPLIGSMFASICVLGIIGVFFPNECSRAFDFGNREKRRNRFHGFKRGVGVSKNDPTALRGHHPTCGHFSSHVFRVKGTILCATCSGLFLGALIVLVGVVSYFFGNLQMGQSAFLLVWSGIMGVIFGLFQPLLLNLHRSFVRVFSSALLAIGSFLILAGIDELARDFFLDVFLVFLTVFWLVTRIHFSQWEHEKMCSTCSSESCDFLSKQKKGV